jgi:NitT/TauT family transport system substrate-binding protein
MKLRLAIPDLVSNSYFPAVAAATLGAFAEQGLDLGVELISPLNNCIDALRDGSVHFVGASAHAPLLSFPNWKGAKLLCAQSQGAYWLLVMRKELGISRGDLGALRGMRIAAVPFVGAMLRQLLRQSKIDPAHVEIISPPFALKPGTNFGVAAAEALKANLIDGFFANGVGAELAIGRGLANLVLDIRRGDGPAGSFHYTMPSVATTDAVIREHPELAVAAVRAIIKTQRALRNDVTLATKVGLKLFDAETAAVITKVVARDLPYYQPGLSRDFVKTMNQYSRDVGLLTCDPAYEEIVANQFLAEWDRTSR